MEIVVICPIRFQTQRGIKRVDSFYEDHDKLNYFAPLSQRSRKIILLCWFINFLMNVPIYLQCEFVYFVPFESVFFRIRQTQCSESVKICHFFAFPSSVFHCYLFIKNRTSVKKHPSYKMIFSDFRFSLI